jgi:hypothetical protein
MSGELLDHAPRCKCVALAIIMKQASLNFFGVDWLGEQATSMTPIKYAIRPRCTFDRVGQMHWRRSRQRVCKSKDDVLY